MQLLYLRQVSCDKYLCRLTHIICNSKKIGPLINILFPASSRHLSLEPLINPFQTGYWSSSTLNSCKQAGAKTRAHISGPWSWLQPVPWLQPVCLQHSTILKTIAIKELFQVGADRFNMAAILYPRVQWVNIYFLSGLERVYSTSTSIGAFRLTLILPSKLSSCYNYCLRQFSKFFKVIQML